MKILVTGATGFLGRFLTEELKEHELFLVHSKNCDLTKADSLFQFNTIHFDQTYHLAVWTQAGDFCLHHPAEQWTINQKIHTHVLDWWQKCQPKAKMIAMGTSCSYSPDYVLKEENYLRGLPIESLDAYAMTKRMLLCGLQAMQKQFGLTYLYIVPSTLYGPGYHIDGRQLHFIFDLIRKILRGKLYDEPVILWGDGSQKRELVHIQDFIKALLQLVSTEKNKVINVGAGKEHSISEFAQNICQVVGYPFDKVQFDVTKYVGARSKILNIEQLQMLLPKYRPQPLKEGLREVSEWFLENKEELLPKDT